MEIRRDRGVTLSAFFMGLPSWAQQRMLTTADVNERQRIDFSTRPAALVEMTSNGGLGRNDKWGCFVPKTC